MERLCFARHCANYHINVDALLFFWAQIGFNGGGAKKKSGWGGEGGTENKIGHSIFIRCLELSVK